MVTSHLLKYFAGYLLPGSFVTVHSDSAFVGVPTLPADVSMALS